MYKNHSDSNNFPKTLEIRNTAGGMIWQTYHVNNLKEAELLSKGANKNGFQCRTLVNFREDCKETFPNWRNNCHKKLQKVLT
jgi:hypothetical protein